MLELHRETQKASYAFLCASVPLWLVLILPSCSVPNLEPPDCTAGRVRVREFYSFHFGNDMHPTPENVRLRERFLTGDHAAKLRADAGRIPPATSDYFTLTEDLPKTFRVGECKVVEPGRSTQFEVILFWKDDYRSEQKEVLAAAKYENNDWLIDSVVSKP